jgi:hypothetical protein
MILCFGSLFTSQFADGNEAKAKRSREQEKNEIFFHKRGFIYHTKVTWTS